LKAALVALMFAATAVAWAALVALFGRDGAAVAVWPALLIGAGGVLTIAQLADMMRLRLAPAAHEPQR
jgi:hypothetical protein